MPFLLAIVLLQSFVIMNFAKTNVFAKNIVTQFGNIYINDSLIDLNELSTISLDANKEEPLQVLLELKYSITNKLSLVQDDKFSEKDWRSEIESFYYDKNSQIAENLLLPKSTYIARFGPFLTFEISKEDNLKEIVENISSSKNVESINIHSKNINSDTVKHEHLYDDMSSTSGRALTISEIMGDYIFANNTDGYSGAGVTIGILEDGLVDKNHPNFVGHTVIVNQIQGAQVLKHTTQVASIITTIAPSAKILSAATRSVITLNNIMPQMDWLISNGANVINNSWGLDEPGVYNWLSAYFDYVVNILGITQVVAISNSGFFMGNPELGRNVISVGSVDSNVMKSSFSSYYRTAQIDALDLMGVGGGGTPTTGLIIPGFADTNLDSGTSYAAPQVTGAIAILMQQNFGLRNSPQNVKALIVASASPIVADDRNVRASGLDEKLGAGLLNLSTAMKNNNPISLPVRNGTNGQVVLSSQFYVSGFTPFRASLVNIVNNRNTSDMSPLFSVYNLRVVDPKGSIVNIDNLPGGEGFFSISRTTYNNVVRISTLLLDSGWYTLEVVLTGNQVVSGEMVSISMIV